jgi:hypothetical protein
MLICTIVRFIQLWSIVLSKFGDVRIAFQVPVSSSQELKLSWLRRWILTLSSLRCVGVSELDDLLPRMSRSWSDDVAIMTPPSRRHSSYVRDVGREKLRSCTCQANLIHAEIHSCRMFTRLQMQRETITLYETLPCVILYCNALLHITC